jgi:3-oxoacyl-[acyl-carrier protein] reductase
LQDQFNNKLHILVNNAAITDPTPIDTLSAPRIQDFLTGNITFPLLLMQAVLPALQPSSHIINISSEAVRIASSGVMVYAATKAALESLTRSWAQELGKRPGMQGTTVNAICVGLTNTELWTRYPVEVRGPVEEANFRTTDVADRIAEVDDVALVAGFLAGDASRWMSGSVLEATGGRAKIF